MSRTDLFSRTIFTTSFHTLLCLIAMKYTAETFIREDKPAPVNASPHPLILKLRTTVENASMALASILKLWILQEMHLESKMAQHLEKRDSSAYSRKRPAQGLQEDPYHLLPLPKACSIRKY